MSTKAKIQKVRNEVQAHEDRGWLKGYEEGLAVREEQTVTAQNANAKLKARIKELKAEKSAPKTAREALDLAWELAHTVKMGETIPDGAHYLRRWTDDVPPTTLSAHGHIDVMTEKHTATVRTLDPLPEPTPDWLDAPAVLARHKDWDKKYDPRVFERISNGLWSWDHFVRAEAWDLRDVTPLYPKEQDA